MSDLGVAYVCFARENPALYRVMYDTARDREDLPDQMQGDKDSAYCKVRDTLVEARRRSGRHPRHRARHHRGLVFRPRPGRDGRLQAVRAI